MEILKAVFILMIIFIAVKMTYRHKLYEDPNVAWLVLFVVLVTNKISPGITGVICLISLVVIAVYAILKFLVKHIFAT